MNLPSNLPAISTARLPQTYKSARAALEKCARVDECSSWAKKAEALASYARQIRDDGLEKMAQRIKARAIRRAGELLAKIQPQHRGDHKSKGRQRPLDRTSAARDAGLSDRQRKDALRVASVPESDFDAAVESEDPPTVTELAAAGTVKRPAIDIGDRSPQDVELATKAIGYIGGLAAFAAQADPAAVLRGCLGKEGARLKVQSHTIIEWCQQLLKEPA